MKKKTKKNKIKPWHIILIILSLAIISFSIYFSALIMTVDGRIVENRPLLGFICEIRPLCYIAPLGGVGCENLDRLLQEKKWPTDPNQIDLIKWNGYHGCNESTKGYSKNYGGYITGIESCSCRNLFG